MRPESPAHIWDALEAARKVGAIVAPLNREEYLADWIRQSAVERQLEIVGEATICTETVEGRDGVQVPLRTLI